LAYLADVKCRNCGSEQMRINSFREPDNSLVVDGATCQVCFSNEPLPTEDYYSFVKEFGKKFMGGK
jgi:hypothetical protein